MTDFARFFERARDLHGIANANGHFRRINPAWHLTLGWTSDELTGSPWLDFVHPEDRELTLDAGTRLFEGTSIVYFENRYRCKDSSYRWLQWHAEMYDGEAYCTGRDVTQEHLQKDARNQRYVEDMAEALPVIVWTASPDGQLEYYNQSWLSYTGMTIAETRGWGWTPVLHSDDRQTCVDRWTEACRSGKPYDIEVRLKRASDGTYRWHLGRALPVRDASGCIVKWFGTCTDIDDQRRAREALLETQQELEVRVNARTAELATSNEQKTSLLREVHHRVKNNLQMISSLVSLQARQAQSAEAQANLLEVQGRVHSIALLHECLYQSQDLGSVDMHDYVGRLIAVIERSYAGPTPGARISAESDSILLPLDTAVPCGLIVNELVTNALKHAFRDAPPGTRPEIQIEMRILGPAISILVTDNGVGFSSALDPTCEQTMGLTLVRDLSRQLRGRVDFASSNGARCMITFPLARKTGIAG